MRWDRLFDDLEIQMAAQERLELDAEVADRTRAERARITLSERLVGAIGAPVLVRTRGGRAHQGVLADVGDGWLALDLGGARACLVASAAVMSVSGLRARPSDDTTARRFGLGYALRGVSRDRRAVIVEDSDGTHVHGTIDAVGADAFEVSEHALDMPRRADNLRGERTIPFAALVSVTSAP